MMHNCIFHPILAKFINFPLFVLFRFLVPHNFITMHLRIMLKQYWTPPVQKFDYSMHSASAPSPKPSIPREMAHFSVSALDMILCCYVCKAN